MIFKTLLKTAFLSATFFLLLNSFACGGKQTRVIDETATRTQDSAKYGTVPAVLASAQVGQELLNVTSSKVDAAFELAANVSGYYRLISSTRRDSLSEAFKNQGKQPTALSAAQVLKPERLFFARVNAFKNLLRVELISRRPPDYSTETHGVGYALLRYANQATGEILYDPAILEAMQRAMIAVEGKSDMFLKADGKLRVEPAETIVAGGIDFENNGITRKWELFEDKVVNSYDAVETIFSILKDNPRYVAVDIGTRDSMYATNGLYMVENYNPPSKLEVETLDRF
ncbi:MAG TPA: hypothetical protein VEC36_10450, partial [Patescibacteria group bacterium]|nr:hypothetical protein [Patescibacteria group bacterium]